MKYARDYPDDNRYREEEEHRNQSTKQPDFRANAGVSFINKDGKEEWENKSCGYAYIQEDNTIQITIDVITFVGLCMAVLGSPKRKQLKIFLNKSDNNRR